MTNEQTTTPIPAAAPPQMNVGLLRYVKSHITDDRRRIDMTLWVREGSASGGWCACIGAWAAILSGQYRPGPYGLVTLDGGRVRDEWGACRDVLGITEEMAGRLFPLDGWPRTYADRYRRWPAGRAQITADRIDHFIATSGAK